MAKTTRAALTRLAATITARYYPTSGATDGFYLDGRITGRREHRAADITLDREERGFFYSVFAHLSGNSADDGALNQVKTALDRIAGEVKQAGRNIDTEINELAECAVSVAGRITLKHDGMKQPYFAGILVRDSELAAVTMGSGCAYLYRGDVLYPLTADDFPLDAIDYSGKAVPGLDVYCAGVAGTVRYSNIAQLQLDDCLIVCNKEVMEALGQREILRMLYEAEDQADAAGLIITTASAKLPGIPMQILIGFVESISSTDKTGRISLTRNQTDVVAAVSGAPAQTQKNTYAPYNQSSAQGASYSGTYGTGVAHGATPSGTAAAGAVATGAVVGAAAGAAAATSGRTEAARREGRADRSDMPAQTARPDYDLDDAAPVVSQTARPERQAPKYAQPIQSNVQRGVAGRNQPDELEEYDDDSFGDEIDATGRGRKIAFYVIIAAICIGCLFLIYNMLFGDKGGEPTGTTTASAVVTTSSESGSETTGTTTAGTTESTAATSTTTSQSETTASSETTQATTTTATTTTGSTYKIIATHTVVSGDTLWGIAMKYYERGEKEYTDLIMAANNMTSEIIKVGDVLQIPEPPAA